MCDEPELTASEPYHTVMYYRRVMYLESLYAPSRAVD